MSNSHFQWPHVGQLDTIHETTGTSPGVREDGGRGLAADVWRSRCWFLNPVSCFHLRCHADGVYGDVSEAGRPIRPLHDCKAEYGE